MRNSRIYNIDMVRGDTLSFGFEVDGIDNLDTAFFTCKRNADDTEYLFQKRLGYGIYADQEGKYGVRIAPEDTQNIDPGLYYYDVEVGVNNDIFTILEGRLKIVQDITSRGDKSSTIVEWGNVNGDIADQIDLQEALNEKANIEDLSAVATSGSYTDLSNTPNLSTVASTGSYNDLSDRPSIPAKTSDLTNDSKFVASTSLANVAFSGTYYALSNTPTIPNKTSQLINDSNFVARSSLAYVAISGSYSDLSDKPKIPQEYVLYDAGSNFATSNFTLNDSIDNYKKIGISYCETDTTSVRGYTEFLVDSALSSRYHEVSAPLTVRSGSEFFDIYIARLRFAGDTVTFIGKGSCQLTTSGISFGTNGCGVKKVIGFK